MKTSYILTTVRHLTQCHTMNCCTSYGNMESLETSGRSSSINLSSQKQCAKINRQFSGLLPVVSGVPQGSILGRLLFTLYINDLPQSLSVARPYLFADDTKCMHAIKDQTDHTSLQNDIDYLTNYSKSWQLKFNVTQCIECKITGG